MNANEDVSPHPSMQLLVDNTSNFALWYAGLDEKRPAIQQRMTQAFDTLLCPLGFKRKGKSHWRKKSALGESAFWFSKRRRGVERYLNVAVRPAQAASYGADEGWDRYVRMGRFCPELSSAQQPDQMHYVRLHDHPAYYDAVMRLFALRMVPWMMWIHQPPPAPPPAPKKGWLARFFDLDMDLPAPPPSQPKPEDMRSVPLFDAQ